MQRAGLGQLDLVLILPPEPEPHSPVPSISSTTARSASDGLLGAGAGLEIALQRAFDHHATASVCAVAALRDQGLLREQPSPKALAQQVENAAVAAAGSGTAKGAATAAAAASSAAAAAAGVACRVGLVVPDLTDPLRAWCGDVGIDDGAVLASTTGGGPAVGKGLGRPACFSRVGRAALLMAGKLLAHELAEATGGAVVLAALSPTGHQEPSGSDNGNRHSSRRLGSDEGSHGGRSSTQTSGVADGLVSVLAGLRASDAGGLFRADGTKLLPA
jgi:hypothetical protein